MRLTTHTDYALRVLIFLGLAPDRMATIGEVSDRYGISRNHLTKIVHELGRAGFIETVRGKNGGMRLGRPAASIRVGEIVRAMEDNMHIVECFNPDAPECQIAPVCVLHDVMRTAFGQFLAVLDSYTLADLVVPKDQLSSLMRLDDVAGAGHWDSE